MKMKRLAMTLVAAGALIFTAACGGGGATDNNPANNGGNAGGNTNTGDTVAAEPPAAYGRCLACHGTDLQGNVGGNSNLQEVGGRLSREEIVNTITNGRQDKGMPAFGNQLSEEEINELADWLSTMK